MIKPRPPVKYNHRIVNKESRVGGDEEGCSHSDVVLRTMVGGVDTSVLVIGRISV